MDRRQPLYKKEPGIRLVYGLVELEPLRLPGTSWLPGCRLFLSESQGSFHRSMFLTTAHLQHSQESFHGSYIYVLGSVEGFTTAYLIYIQGSKPPPDFVAPPGHVFFAFPSPSLPDWRTRKPAETGSLQTRSDRFSRPMAFLLPGIEELHAFIVGCILGFVLCSWLQGSHVWGYFGRQTRKVDYLSGPSVGRRTLFGSFGVRLATRPPSKLGRLLGGDEDPGRWTAKCFVNAIGEPITAVAADRQRIALSSLTSQASQLALKLHRAWPRWCMGVAGGLAGNKGVWLLELPLVSSRRQRSCRFCMERMGHEVIWRHGLLLVRDGVRSAIFHSGFPIVT